jgi:hypothetical protein
VPCFVCLTVSQTPLLEHAQISELQRSKVRSSCDVVVRILRQARPRQASSRRVTVAIKPVEDTQPEMGAQSRLQLLKLFGEVEGKDRSSLVQGEAVRGK